jgi:valyl-tRNA synthetase
MPFITEALWEQTGGEGLLMIQPWPELPDDYVDEAASDEMRRVIAVIAEGRSIRSELNVPASARPPLLIIRADDHLRQELEANAAIIGQMLRISGLEFVSEPGPGAAPYIAEGVPVALPVAEFVDLAAERSRLDKELAASVSEVDRAERKLANPDFIAKAPAEVVEESQERLQAARSTKARLEAAKGRLEALA